MKTVIPHLFAEVAAKLDDLHAIAIEGKRHDNAPDMQSALALHLRFGLATLDTTMRAVEETLDGQVR